jgi:hypothetical protein
MPKYGCDTLYAILPFRNGPVAHTSVKNESEPDSNNFAKVLDRKFNDSSFLSCRLAIG